MSSTTTPGTSAVITTGTTSALEATLSLPSILLAPGATQRFSISLQTAAAGTALGWGAFTDASNSVQMSMLLPAGVTLDAPGPLLWVTAVPEPSTILLMLAGLAGLAVRKLLPSRRRA